MKNFRLIDSGLDVNKLMLKLHQLDKSKGIWREDTFLRHYPQGPFGECESIILRFQPVQHYDDEAQYREQFDKIDQHECVDRDVFRLLPEARAIVFMLMAYVEGERLGRVIINKMIPGGKIFPHSDGEAHALYYDRHHIVLQSTPGAIFRAGSDQVTMPTGSVWWFDNSQDHEVINNGSDDRIHMIVDIRTRQ
jgi:hypothetical protein